VARAGPPGARARLRRPIRERGGELEPVEHRLWGQNDEKTQFFGQKGVCTRPLRRYPVASRPVLVRLGHIRG